MIRLTEDDFMKLRPSRVDEGIKDRLDHLLGEYECFKITEPPRSSAPRHVDTSFKDTKRSFGNVSPATPRTGRNVSHRKPVYASHRKPTTHQNFAAPHPRRPVTYDRELKSTLNKLTRHNYGKLASSILNFKTDTNLDLLLASLLEKCYKQTCFLDLFVSLIVDLYANADDDAKACIDNTLAEFVETFMGSKNLLNFRMRSTNLDYEGFCDDMITRNNIVGKHRTVLALLARIMDEPSKKVYIRSMLGVLDTSLESETKRVDAHSDAYELILDLMMDFVVADGKMAKQVRDHFTSRGMFFDTLPANISNRARFKIKDILTS